MCVDRSCEQAEKVLKAFVQRHLVLTSKIKAINTDGYIQLGAAHKEEGSSQPITTAAEDRPDQALPPPEFLLRPGTVPLRLHKSSDSSFLLKRGGFQVSPSFFQVRRQSGTAQRRWKTARRQRCPTLENRSRRDGKSCWFVC